jgi:hypothetical protein
VSDLLGVAPAAAVVVAGGAVRVSGVSRRWSGSYAGAGYPKTLVSSHVRCLEVERGRRGRLLIARARNCCARVPGARTAPPPTTGCGEGELVGQGDLPAEAGEFARDRDRHDVVGLAALVF